jgi:hypothetical protein
VGTGGSGGGGDGGNADAAGQASIAPTNGTANTGGGGGGHGAFPQSAANGGSGVVILKYPTSLTIGGGSGLTFSTSTVGASKITTFTLGTGSISFS